MADSVTLAFQNLLHKKPLFEYIGKDEAQMNVLVLGWDKYSTVFVDQCLQAGQMESHFLNVKVLTAGAEKSLKEYLYERPALADFVNVNGSLDGKDLDAYASLCFEEYDVRSFAGTYDEMIAERILDILSDAPDEKYHYIMVSVENENINRMIAGNIKISVDDFMPSEKNTIHYISEKGNEEVYSGDIYPVSVGGIKNLADIDPDLERMAYNAHLIWADTINGDALSELEKFKVDRYNYLSSVALALSVTYKLADLGILNENKHLAAEEFWKRIRDNNNQDLVNHMIALEHRRWVINLCCEGWCSPKPEERQKYYDDCIERRNVKDKEKKIHPCIVRSTVDSPLSTGIYAEDKSAWDIKNVERDACLDDLDRMSVELHRRMLAKANAYRKSNPLERDEVVEIREKLRECNVSDGMLREWERFIFCLKNILDGNWAYSKQFRRYRDHLLSHLYLDDNSKGYIEKRIDSLSDKFWPVIEANLYRDYKRNDVLLVKKIPFILTYEIHLSLALAFRTASSLNTMNDIIFRNVASATVIKPERITYLLFLDDTARQEIIRQMIQTVQKYMAGKGIRCELSFLITGQRSTHEQKDQQWRKCFDKLKHTGYLSEYSLQFVDSDQEAIDFWASELSEKTIDLFDGSTNLFQSMSANGEFLNVIQERYPYFEFNCKNKLFKNNKNCRYLSYIEDHTYLGIEEMFGLVGAEDMEYHYPMLGNEYRKLWNIYIGRNRGNKIRWKENVRYAVKCWNVMCDTLENFDEKYPQKEVIDLKELQESYRGYQRWNDILNIIRELAGEGGGKQYLLPEKTDGKLVGFRYSNPDIKSVLTKAGDILEIYTYFTVCEMGWFDEVACGYRFRWEGEKVNNELDLVLTKGFQSLIVECKARSKLDQNFYFKLNSLVDMFGIGAHKVLLTTAKTDEGDNQMQQERGNMMGITTISEIDDIQDIADQFRKLLCVP